MLDGAPLLFAQAPARQSMAGSFGSFRAGKVEAGEKHRSRADRELQEDWASTTWASCPCGR